MDSDRMVKMNEEYYIGQVFVGIYPDDVAGWCKQHNAYVEAIGDNRYEIKEIRAPTPEQQKEMRIDELKQQLSDTDYKIIKCSEYQMSQLELPYDIAELHAQRQALRDEINELEQ